MTTTTAIDTTRQDTIKALLMFALIVAIHAIFALGVAQLAYILISQIN